MIGRRVLRGLGLADRQMTAPGRGRYTSALEPFYSPGSSIMGENVTVEKTLGLGTVYACIRILAETIGTTPLLAYTEQANREKIRDYNSPAWQLLHEQPNPSASPTDVWTTLATWLVGWGDAFLGKQFARSGELVALWPIHPEMVDVGLINGQKVFDVRRPGELSKRYTGRDVIQIMGQSFTGIRGSSPLTMARGEFVVSLAAQRYAAAVYKNVAVPRGALKTSKELSDEAIERLRADWQRIYGGSANAGKVAILEEDMQFEQISMPMRDVQFVEQQNLSIQTIARIFRVPLSLIQADSPGGLTYRTAETENLQFLTHAVRPWYVRIEQALNRDPDLFPSNPVSFAEFLPDALLRVATKDRFDAYKVATGKPWMRPSEVRKAENLPADDTIDDQPSPEARGAASAPLNPAEAAPTQ